MSENTHASLGRSLKEYGESTSPQGNGAPLQALVTHPQQLKPLNGAALRYDPVNHSELFTFRTRVEHFEVSKEESARAYEEIMTRFWNTPAVVDNDLVHYMLKSEDHTFFNGRAYILVRWTEATYNPSKAPRNSLHLPTPAPAAAPATPARPTRPPLRGQTQTPAPAAPPELDPDASFYEVDSPDVYVELGAELERGSKKDPDPAAAPKRAPLRGTVGVKPTQT
jgi:hypothetical protein